MVKKLKANLHGDIIETNILTRLPVEALIRFTAVCKSWYSLLSDPCFINMHHKIQKSNLLMVYNIYESRVVIKGNNNDCPSFESVDLVGCCDGIVCVFGTKPTDLHISLWNPALKISKTITTYNPWSGHGLCVGFFYHHQTDDYKVIKFASDWTTPKNVEIYSLNSDSWMKIDQLAANQLLTGMYCVEAFGVYLSCCLSGGYYWLASKLLDDQDKGYCEPRIITFDFNDEVFKEMTLPSYATGVNELFVYKDSLAVLTNISYISDASLPHNLRVIYISVMKEYNDPKSWTKLCKFDSQCPYTLFIGVIETDLILMLRGKGSNKEVNVVDIDKPQLKPISYTKDITFLTEARQVCSFSESLALLKGVGSLNSLSD